MAADRRGWELHLRHYGRDGVIKNAFIAPLAARYANSLDGDDPLVFAQHENTYAQLVPIVEFDIMEVMIRNRALGVQSATGGFVRDFVGIVRGSAPNRDTDDDGQAFLTWRAPEQKHIFAWRRVAWPAGTADRSVFTNQPAETVAKTLITYNCAAAASVANGRHRAGSTAAMGAALDIEADAAQGDNVSLTFSGALLLDALARVCELGGDYYQVEWQGGGLNGAHEYAVTWGRGSDKSAGAGRVLFSMATNTLRQPRRQYAPAAGTVAIAAGQGQGDEREIEIVPGDDYAATNDIEFWVDARDVAAGDTDGLEGRALSKLDEAAERSDLDFEVIQTADIFYSPVDVTGRKTYQVGDRVLVSYGGEEVRRIRRAAVVWQDQGGDLLQVAIETELWEGS